LRTRTRIGRRPGRSQTQTAPATRTNKVLIRFEDVHKSYGGSEVLSGVTFQVNPGEHVGLVGRNGAGKTTLFRLAERVEEPDSGQVFLPRGIRLGVVSQQPVFPEGDAARSLRNEALSVFAEMQTIERDMARHEHEMADATGAELDQIMHSYSDLRHR